ncbi:hypothetical protein LTR62_002876 [Meristemomyces frigidus]|uniref:Isochorismatase-like domain-containing protein n=1 Tax=Meristemomyces frigidus TaxID=1508187 RepID=A0AAN7TQK7_9PEZI|nr:hypothetical protein LTR62_002876 [Meristemomyces frigidus]
MTANGDTTTHQHAIIGPQENQWLYSSKTGFDLSRSADKAAGKTVTLKTSTTPITLDPAKSALVIIDMQNFFLSEAFGRKKDGSGHAALKRLVEVAVPAARKAGIRVVWLNWGLTDDEVRSMPPAVTRAFGFEVMSGEKGEGEAASKQGATLDLAENAEGRYYKGLGSECGLVRDPATGQEIDAGRLLVRGAWNSALYPPLDKMYEEGRLLEQRSDVWIHKNRMSGMWGAKSECEEFLDKEGIRTLLFTGVNTDQCVGGTLTDSFSKGYDCILLNDGAATSSPEFAQKCFEFNAGNTFGFATTCEALAEGVNSMEH